MADFFKLDCLVVKSINDTLKDKVVSTNDCGINYNYLDFLKENLPKVDEGKLRSLIYERINDLESSDDKDRIIAALVSEYLLNIYHDSNSYMADYLKKHDFSSVLNLFHMSRDFGECVISCYLNNKSQNIEHNDIYASPYGGTYLKLLDIAEHGMKTKNVNIISCKSLSNILREIWIDLFEHYIKFGYSENDALSAVWTLFFNNIDPIGTLDKYCDTEEQKANYKRVMLRLMYSDIYEDIINDGCFNVPDEYKQPFYSIIFIAIQSNQFNIIPREENIRNFMLKYYLVLLANDMKMKDNRSNSMSDQKLAKSLLKANPMFPLDDIK